MFTTSLAHAFKPFAQIRQQWEEKGISTEIVYVGDWFANTEGGTKRGDSYLGNLDLSATFDTKALGLWDHGTLFVYALDNHGTEKLTGEIVGDTQTISNIEAPRAFRLFELWYEHTFNNDKISALIGLHDFNSEFNVTEYGGLFINSSFGVNAEIASGARPSIFPLAGPAFRLKVIPNEQWTALFGVYDGDPGDPEISEHLPRSILASEGGAFIAGEVTYHFINDELPGFIKIGKWYNTGDFDNLTATDSNGNAVVENGNYGGYVIIDKMLYHEDAEQGLGGFIQFGASPEDRNEVHMYVGGGLNYKGLIPSRDDDNFGIAVAHAIISDDLVDAGGRENGETALEITYSAQISENLRIQPDIQFIFHPGADTNLNTAKVFGLRFEFIL